MDNLDTSHLAPAINLGEPARRPRESDTHFLKRRVAYLQNQLDGSNRRMHSLLVRVIKLEESVKEIESEIFEDEEYQKEQNELGHAA